MDIKEFERLKKEALEEMRSSEEDVMGTSVINFDDACAILLSYLEEMQEESKE